MTLIEARDIWQKRDGHYLLKDINLRVERGEVFVIIGPTGAGKTTLLRLFDLLDTPARGAVFYNGADTAISEKARLETSRKMAFVLQKPVVFNTSVFENVASGLKWRGLSKQEVRDRVDAVLEKVEMTEYRNRNARTLSGGETQRVAIARAIATEPEVLIMDEPTANLDPVSASNIEDLIAGIIRQEMITVIMATHDMAQGQRLADRMCVLASGEIMQTGTPHDIFSRPRTLDVAEFVGMDNAIEGVVLANEGDLATIDISGKVVEAVSEYQQGERVSVCLRPEDVTVAINRASSSARNSLAGTITWVVTTGPFGRVEIDCGFPLVALVTKRSVEELGLKKGTQVYATFKAVSIHVLKRI